MELACFLGKKIPTSIINLLVSVPFQKYCIPSFKVTQSKKQNKTKPSLFKGTCPSSSWLKVSSKNTQLLIHPPQSHCTQASPKAIALFIQWVLIPSKIMQYLKLNQIEILVVKSHIRYDFRHFSAHFCLSSGFMHSTRSFTKIGKTHYRLSYVNFSLEVCAAFSISCRQILNSWIKCPQSLCCDWMTTFQKIKQDMFLKAYTLKMDLYCHYQFNPSGGTEWD